jgi:dihydroorotase
VLDQPNLTPPITTTDQALEYKATLERIDPETEFLMTLYLSPDLTPDEVRRAKAAGIVGSSSATNISPSSCPPRSQVISKGRHN